MADTPVQKGLHPDALSKPKVLSVTSPAFAHGEAIPREFTCQGDDASPPLGVAPVPAGTRALAVLMDDPDAPGGTFTHWLAWNLPPDTVQLPRGADVIHMGGMMAENDFGRASYGGPCPPRGETHRYFFRVFALREPLTIEATASARDVWRAVGEKAVAWGELMGTYQKA